MGNVQDLEKEMNDLNNGLQQLDQTSFLTHSNSNSAFIPYSNSNNNNHNHHNQNYNTITTTDPTTTTTTILVHNDTIQNSDCKNFEDDGTSVCNFFDLTKDSPVFDDHSPLITTSPASGLSGNKRRREDDSCVDELLVFNSNQNFNNHSITINNNNHGENNNHNHNYNHNHNNNIIIHTMNNNNNTLVIDNSRVSDSLFDSDPKLDDFELDNHKSNEDGYRWRKYGRKVVKGSKYPRNYFKCTFPGCQVKKQVEILLKDSLPAITVTYKGSHDHEPPQITQLRADDQQSFKSIVISSSKIQNPEIPPNSSSNSGNLPRLVVETGRLVNHLDDGFHWRKYGQKNVKGSKFPRSYYRCTESDCHVKKQVDQLDETVINTYEGTHNHFAPALDGSKRKRRKPSFNPQIIESSSSNSNDSSRQNTNISEFVFPNVVLPSISVGLFGNENFIWNQVGEGEGGNGQVVGGVEGIGLALGVGGGQMIPGMKEVNEWLMKEEYRVQLPVIEQTLGIGVGQQPVGAVVIEGQSIGQGVGRVVEQECLQQWMF